MTSEFFKDFTEKTKEGFTPFVKFNELVSTSVQDMLKAQMAATQRYSEMTMDQVKAASEIRDVESLQSFFKQQVSAFEALNEQVMSDLKAMADAGTKFREDVEAIINPVQEEVAEAPTKKAPAKAAPKAAAKS